jgi:hypothetical protein
VPDSRPGYLSVRSGTLGKGLRVWNGGRRIPVASEHEKDESVIMRIIAFDRFKPGVTMETIQPLLAAEVANVWRLWKSGVVRENYARADEPGVIIVFEVESVAAAKALVAEFPMTRAGYLEWFYVPLMAPVMLESQFSDTALAQASRPAATPA